MASTSRSELFQLVTIRNPFRPTEREITPLPIEGRTVASYLPADLPVVAGLNGRVLNADEISTVIPRAGDYLVLCPVIGKGGGGGKNPLATIAAIALTVMTFGGGGVLAGGLFAGGSTSWLMAGALLYLGGSLLGGVGAKAAQVDLPNTDASAWENGHSWGDMQPIARQGGTVPNTYGTVRITGQILNQHVTSDGKKQYLNLLLSGGEGPIDSISGIKINNNPPENFGGIADDDELFDTYPGTTLDAVGETATASTPVAATALDIELYWPNGMIKNGTFWGGSVGIKIEYRVSGGSWATWKTETVTQRSYSAFSRTYRIDDLPGAIYETRITLTSADATTYAFQYKRLSYVQKAVAVAIETKLGTNTQTPISFFGDSFADQVFSIELTDDGYSEYQTEGDGGAGLEITLAFPQGLCYVNDDGSPSESWVKIDVDYRLVGAPAWTSWLSAQEIRDKKQGSLRRTFRKDSLTQGQYEVRAKINSVHGTGTRFVNQTVWNTLSHIIYDDFKRPGKVLLGIRAMATDKLSGGMPSISWLQTRSTVHVYVPGSGYTTKAATNPAWICYDLIHRARYLEDPRTGTSSYVVRGDPHSRIDYSAFEAWAAYCDELVDGAKRSEANIYLDAPASVWDQLQKVAQIGRGMVVMRGTQFSCVFDGQVSTPVQLFTVGNVLEDTLNGEYLTGRDRANAIEISFNNADKDYQRDVVMVYDDGYDANTGVNSPTQVTLPGITDYRRAYREGLYRLRLNKYIKRSISWQADIDALACQVGDVVLVQHDIPRWGNGGRVVSATANTITLDRPVHMSPGTTYAVKVRLADGTLVDKTVTAVLVDTDTAALSLTTNWTVQPVAYDLYSFGVVDLTAKPFRVTKISRSGDLRVRIDATEYYSEVYEETATVPEVDYTVALPTVTGLMIGFSFDMAGHAFLDISWTPPRGSYGGAIVMIDGKTVSRVGMTQSAYSHRVVNDKTYSVAVIGLDAAGHELAPVFGSYTVSAIGIPTVTWGTVTEGDSYYLADGNVATDLMATFTVPDYQLFKSVRIYYQLDGEGLWFKAGETSTGTFVIRNIKIPYGTSVQVDARIVNRFNVEGASALSDAVVIQAKFSTPAAPTGLNLTSGVEILKDGSASVYVNGTYAAGAGTNYVGVEIGTGATPTDWSTATQSNSGTFRIRGLAHSTLYSVRLTPYNMAGTGIQATGTITTTSDTTAPGVPPAPTTELLFKSIIVKIAQNATKAPDLAGFEVWRNTTNNSGTASKVGFAPCAGTADGASFLDDTTGYGTTYYYWTKAVDKTGNVSGFSVASDAVVTQAIIAGDIASGALNTSALFASGVVDAAAIANCAVTAAKTCLAAINSSTGNLNAGVVGTTQLVDGAVSAVKTALAAINATTGKIAQCAIDCPNMFTGRPVDSTVVTTGELLTLSAQIKDAIIVNSKIACLDACKINTGTLAAARIAAGSLSADKISGTALVIGGAAGDVNSGSTCICGGRIVTGSLTSTQIISSGICGLCITVGTLTGDRIAANTITSSKMLISAPGAALNDDPGFEDPSAWTNGASFIHTVADGKVGNNAAFSGAGDTVMYSCKYVPMDVTKVYRIRGWARQQASANGVLYLGIDFLDSNGNSIEGVGYGTFWYYAAYAATPGTSWTEYYALFGAAGCSVPSNAKKMRLISLLNYGGNTGCHELQDFRIEEVLPATLIQDGAITTSKIIATGICGSCICAGSITATQLATNSVTADKIDVGDLCAIGATIGGWTINETYISKWQATGGISLQTAQPTVISIACGSVGSYATHGKMYWSSAYQNAFGFAVTNGFAGGLAAGMGLANSGTVTLPDSSTVACGCPFFWVGDSTNYVKYNDSLLTVKGNVIVQDGSITTSKLRNSSTGGALNPDPYFCDPSEWREGDAAPNYGYYFCTISDGARGNTAILTADGWAFFTNKTLVPVTPGKQYRVSWTMRAQTHLTYVYPMVNFYATGSEGDTSSWTYFPTYITPSEWCYRCALITIPAGQRFMRIGIHQNSGSYATYYQDLRIEEAVDTAKIASGAIGGLTMTSTALYSSNYSAGSAGFCIGCGGNAEFNDVTVRGTVCATAGYISNFCITTDGLNSHACCNASYVSMRTVASGYSGYSLGYIFAGGNLGKTNCFGYGSSCVAIQGGLNGCDYFNAPLQVLLGCGSACVAFYSNGCIRVSSVCCSSDRNLKYNISAVEVLPRIRSLAMSEWSFKGESVRHVGPMAQDFYEIFKGYSSDPKAIGGLDGIALKGVQELDGCVESLKICIKSLEDRLCNLETRFAAA